LRSGQDGELQFDITWPKPRFQQHRYGVRDNLTGLVWTKTAYLTGEPVDWHRAFDAVKAFNKRANYSATWRLPTINELESLVDCSQANPALQISHPFSSLQDVYWSATTSVYETDWAWALYLNKGALGVGQKQQARFHVWAVYGLDA
jgi:hypothetical protein